MSQSINSNFPKLQDLCLSIVVTQGIYDKPRSIKLGASTLQRSVDMAAYTKWKEIKKEAINTNNTSLLNQMQRIENSIYKKCKEAEYTKSKTDEPLKKSLLLRANVYRLFEKLDNRLFKESGETLHPSPFEKEREGKIIVLDGRVRHYPLLDYEKYRHLEKIQDRALFILWHSHFLKLLNLPPDLFQNPEEIKAWLAIPEHRERLSPFRGRKFSHYSLPAIPSCITPLLRGRKLQLSSNPIFSLDGLRNLPHLTRLCLENCCIEFIQTLSQLERLESLNLRNNRIADVAPLAKLGELYELNLSRNKVENIKPLKVLTQLNFLSLSNNPLSDPSALSKLTLLATLRLRNCGLKEIPFMPMGVITLNLASNALKDLHPLARHPQLTKLNIAGNQIQDLTPLRKVSRLDFLDASSNPLVSLRGIPRPTIEDMFNFIVGLGHQLPGVKVLKLSHCGLNNNHLKSYPFPQSLQVLDLSYNNIRKLGSLTALEFLRKLTLSNNFIVKIKVLKNLVSLNKLDLSNNQITDFRMLIKMPNLKQIDYPGNPIPSADQRQAQ